MCVCVFWVWVCLFEHEGTRARVCDCPSGMGCHTGNGWGEATLQAYGLGTAGKHWGYSGKQPWLLGGLPAADESAHSARWCWCSQCGMVLLVQPVVWLAKARALT